MAAITPSRILVNIATSENNLVIREAITGYVGDTLRGWQENCD